MCQMSESAPFWTTTTTTTTTLPGVVLHSLRLVLECYPPPSPDAKTLSVIPNPASLDSHQKFKVISEYCKEPWR